MTDMTALCAVAREFSMAVERRILHDDAFREAALPRLKERWDDRVLSGLGAAEAGYDLLNAAPSRLPYLPMVSFMRAGMYASLLRACAPDGEEKARALIPAAMKTEENRRAIDALDGAFAELFRPPP